MLDKLEKHNNNENMRTLLLAEAKRRFFFVVIVFLLNCMNVVSQSNEFPKIMYVNAADGLRKRASASVDSAVIGSLAYGERVVISGKYGRETIGGITGYWYSIRCNYYDSKSKIYYEQAWVFGGYLSENLPSDVPAIIGLWEEEDDNRLLYYFNPNYFRIGAKESEWFKNGKWKINGNTVIFTTEYGAYEELDSPIIEKAILTIVNMNYIILEYSNKIQFKLIRSNDCDTKCDF